MPRRKKETVHAPQNASEATLMIAEYVQLERKAALERLAAEDAIDKVKAQRDTALREIEVEAKDLFAGIKVWWEAGGNDDVARGKKSAEIANAKVGIRTGMPQVKLARKVKLGDVVAWLRGLRWSEASTFLRTKVTLDKEAVIKAVRADPQTKKKFSAHLTVEQGDEFFIDTGLDDDALKAELAAS